MHRIFETAAGSISLIPLLLGVAGCSPAPRPSCPTPPAPPAPRQSQEQSYLEGYHAGELAQALFDRARARAAAAALFKSKGDPLMVATAIAVPPPSPPAVPQATTRPAGPAVPLDQDWLGY